MSQPYSIRELDDLLKVCIWFHDTFNDDFFSGNIAGREGVEVDSDSVRRKLNYVAELDKYIIESKGMAIDNITYFNLGPYAKEMMQKGGFKNYFKEKSEKEFDKTLFDKIKKKLLNNKIVVLIVFAFIIFSGIFDLWSKVSDFFWPPKLDLEHYEKPAPDLIKLKLEQITAVDFGPKPESKNLIFEFKVIPKSKDKYVPIKNKGELLIIESSGKEEKYSFDANFDDGGIKPKIISYIFLDGLISRELYKKIVKTEGYRAKCIFYYDNDIILTKQNYLSEIFDLDKTTISDLSQKTIDTLP